MTDRITHMIDVWLEPGAKAHRCLGIVFDFESASEARQFDDMKASIQIEPLDVYGVSNQPVEQPNEPSRLPVGRLPDATNI